MISVAAQHSQGRSRPFPQSGIRPGVYAGLAGRPQYAGVRPVHGTGCHRHTADSLRGLFCKSYDMIAQFGQHPRSLALGIKPFKRGRNQ